MESVIKTVFEVAIVSREIECADRIVYETGIYKAVIVSASASECIFLYIEVGRLSLLIVALYSIKGKVMWFGWSTVNLILRVSAFQNMIGFFEVCQYICKTDESVFHVPAIKRFERSWKDITGVRYVHDDIRRCYIKFDEAECPQRLCRVLVNAKVENERSVFACQLKEFLKSSSSN